MTKSGEKGNRSSKEELDDQLDESKSSPAGSTDDPLDKKLPKQRTEDRERRGRINQKKLKQKEKQLETLEFVMKHTSSYVSIIIIGLIWLLPFLFILVLGIRIWGFFDGSLLCKEQAETLNGIQNTLFFTAVFLSGRDIVSRIFPNLK